MNGTWSHYGMRPANSRTGQGTRYGAGDEGFPRNPHSADSSPVRLPALSRPHDQLHDLVPYRHVDIPLIVHRRLAGGYEAVLGPFPLSHVLTRGQELLYAVVAGVHDEHIAFAVHRQTEGFIELPGARARSSPLGEALTSRRELFDPLVSGTHRMWL